MISEKYSRVGRDLKIDGLKFVMIYLVVLGHLSYDDYGLEISKIIYSFHMPVFCFLSGLFTSPNADKEKQFKWIKQTFIIYIFAQLAHLLLRVAISFMNSELYNEAFDMSIFTWNVLISPYLALWYLICLIYWRLSIWRVFNNTSDIILLCISFVLALTSGFIPLDYELSFQRAFSFYPFFVLGFIFRKHNLIYKLNQTPYIYAILIFLVGIVVSRFIPTYMPKMHYSNWHILIVRLIQSVLGIVLCLSIIRISKIKFIERFAKYGVYTLWIYIGHTYLIIMGKEVFPKIGISLNIISASVLACVYCTIFIFIAQLYYNKK